MKLLTHRIEPIALDKTTVAIIPVAAESNPWPAHTRTDLLEDVVRALTVKTERGIWIIMGSMEDAIVGCVAIMVDVALEDICWSKRAVLEREAVFVRLEDGTGDGEDEDVALVAGKSCR